jgi:hypothetical protein
MPKMCANLTGRVTIPRQRASFFFSSSTFILFLFFYFYKFPLLLSFYSSRTRLVMLPNRVGMREKTLIETRDAQRLSLKTIEIYRKSENGRLLECLQSLCCCRR